MSMSEAELRLRQIFVDTALEYVGTKEGDSRHKEIVDIYNTITPLRFGYKMNTSLAWCAAFVSAMAQKCGITSICFTSRGCSDLVNQYRAAGRYREASSYTPQLGDWIMYAKSGESDYRHVGIFIETKSDGKIRTVEGNISNSVMELQDAKRYHRSYYIAGYCQPDYASIAPQIQPVSKPYTRIFYNNKWWKATPNLYVGNKWSLCRDWTHTNGTWYTSGEIELEEPPAAEIVDVSGTYSKNAELSSEEMEVNARYIWQVFQKRGWTLNAVAGMLGNMEYESYISPGKWENEHTGDPKYGFGLVQWTPASKYLGWCSERGLDPSHMDSAIARIQWEYDNGKQYYKTSAFPLTFKQFSESTATPEYLAEVFIRNYERPESKAYTKLVDKEGTGVLKTSLGWRQYWARKWYDYLSTTIYLPTT